MWTELHWIDGAWPGKLAVSARPRGGDWLPDEIANWKKAGVGAVLSLLTPEEEKELDLRDEARLVREQGIQFNSFPIPDLHTPTSEAKFAEALDKLSDTLSSGKNLLIHCRQGLGRSGLVAACLLVTKGLSSDSAVDTVSAARGVSVPETKAQREWIDRYAATLTSTK